MTGFILSNFSSLKRTLDVAACKVTIYRSNIWGWRSFRLQVGLPTTGMKYGFGWIIIVIFLKRH